jgi:hypothetical protein
MVKFWTNESSFTAEFAESAESFDFLSVLCVLCGESAPRRFEAKLR